MATDQPTKLNDSATKSSTFALDLEAIRKRARSHIEGGAVTDAYRADLATVLRILDGALATEITCVLRYKRHAVMAPAVGGIAGAAIAAELEAHAGEEQAHADRIASRIVTLGGTPNFDPATLARIPFGLRGGSHAEGDAPGGFHRRAHRHRDLRRDRPVPGRPRPHVAPHDGGDYGPGRGARRRGVRLAGATDAGRPAAG